VKEARGNRTSKGAEKWLDVQRTWGTRNCIEHLRACGYRILVTQLTPNSVPIQQIDWTQPTAFILGNEVDGDPPLTDHVLWMATCEMYGLSFASC
jgi:tRNA G18 (ribose-2'-O)-methylase SpoU